ncbi:MAG: extracellular solute-binding protein [Ardenticatenia bacterium]|nr:MAG: extracellular solute-binding protein [Ardenticatenia bacterium]
MRRWLLVLGLLVLAACRQIQPPPPGPQPPWDAPPPTPTPAPQGVVRVLASWRGGEEAGFLLVAEAFKARTGIVVEYVSNAEVADGLLAEIEAGTPPDIVFLPKPNWLTELASANAIPPLPEDAARALQTHYAPAWVALVTYEGQPYGVPFRANSKSLLWYRPDRVGTETPPATLDDLDALTDRLAAQGTAPLSVPARDGWPLTDWFENILLAEAGRATTEALAMHRTTWTAPEVRAAAERYVALLEDRHLLGGAVGALDLALAESTDAFVQGDAAMWLGLGPVMKNALQKRPDVQFGRDVRVWDFPADGGVVGIVDTAVALNTRPETAALLAWLATPEAAQLWVEAPPEQGYFISPNRDVPLEAYTDPLQRTEAAQLQQARTFVYDLSDRLPRLLTADVQTGLQRLLREPDALDEVLTAIETTAAREQGIHEAR